MIRFQCRTAEPMSNFLIQKKIKRIILVSMDVIVSSVIFNCTDDTAEKNTRNTTAKVVADNSAEPIQIPPIKP